MLFVEDLVDLPLHLRERLVLRHINLRPRLCDFLTIRSTFAVVLPLRNRHDELVQDAVVATLAALGPGDGVDPGLRVHVLGDDDDALEWSVENELCGRGSWTMDVRDLLVEGGLTAGVVREAGVAVEEGREDCEAVLGGHVGDVGVEGIADPLVLLVQRGVRRDVAEIRNFRPDVCEQLRLVQSQPLVHEGGAAEQSIRSCPRTNDPEGWDVDVELDLEDVEIRHAVPVGDVLLPVCIPTTDDHLPAGQGLRHERGASNLHAWTKEE